MEMKDREGDNTQLAGHTLNHCTVRLCFGFIIDFDWMAMIKKKNVV
jgi:hypothetical protein